MFDLFFIIFVLVLMFLAAKKAANFLLAKISSFFPKKKKINLSSSSEEPKLSLEEFSVKDYSFSFSSSDFNSSELFAPRIQVLSCKTQKEIEAEKLQKEIKKKQEFENVCSQAQISSLVLASSFAKTKSTKTSSVLVASPEVIKTEVDLTSSNEEEVIFPGKMLAY